MAWRPQDRDPAYNRGWRQARKRAMERSGGRCEIRGPGCHSQAVTVDHIYGIKADPQHRHLQAACQPCHDAKTKTEAVAGRTGRRTDPEPRPSTAW